MLFAFSPEVNCGFGVSFFRMEYGKPIPYSFSHIQKIYGNQVRSICSPLVFSTIFNDVFFYERYISEYYAKNNGNGLMLPQENDILLEFSKSKFGRSYKQHVVFETNGKFNIPPAILRDILMDYPERNECYLYLIYYVFNGGYHKNALIQTEKKFYVIDSNESFVLVYDHEEYIASIKNKIITNFSIIVEDSKIPLRYERKDFLHIL